MHRSVLHIPDAELHVMQVIWDAPVPLSTTQIIQTVQKEINPAWKMPTIRTFLARLITKGYLTVESDSKERYYIAVIDEQAYLKSVTRKFLIQHRYDSLLEVFALMRGEQLMQLTDDDLQQLKHLLSMLDDG